MAEGSGSEPLCTETTDIIFVVGSSRSGTTMMGRVLGAHSAIHTFPELHYFGELWSPDEGIAPLDQAAIRGLAARLISIYRDGYLHAGSGEGHEEEAADFLRRLRPDQVTAPAIFESYVKSQTLAAGKRISCDQTPRNAFYLSEILGYFPRAIAVAMVRDPRAVLLSQKLKWRRRFLGGKQSIPRREALRAWANYHPLVIIRMWLASTRSAMKHGGNPRVMTLRFETLLDEPEGSVRRICDFLGVEYEPLMLRVPQAGSSSRQDDPSKKGIDASRISSWKNSALSATEIYLCEKIAESEMTYFGYEASGAGPNPLLLAYYTLLLPFKLTAALILNFRRATRVIDEIRRRLA